LSNGRSSLRIVAAFPSILLRIGRETAFTVGQVAWRLIVHQQQYRELEAGERRPDFETRDGICKL
jgi:hypothetical protein